MSAARRIGPQTPLEAWPPRKFSGRPGYSARHFASLSGAPDDPLRVAERIACEAIRHRIADEARTRIAAGEDLSAVRDWQYDAIGDAKMAEWERLCGSFDAVIAALESAPQTPGMKQLVRQAKQAKHQAEGT